MVKLKNNNNNNEFDVDSIEENSLNGYILEDDLEHPNELHELHNDYLLAPEKLEIRYVDMLSKYCSEIAKKYDIKTGGISKLVPNLGNKSKSFLHYKILQL